MIKSENKIITGIVISTSPYMDDSAICNLITNKGFYSVVLKHSYKLKNNLKPLLIPFNYVEVEYIDSKKDNLIFARSVKTIKDYSNNYYSYDGNLFLQCIVQLTSLLFKISSSFDLDNLLNILDSFLEKKDLLSLLLLLIGSYYKSLGLNQEVNKCVLCFKKEGIASYSINDGGFICKDCIKKNTEYKVKNNLELYVFKYAFLDINKENLNKKVPLIEGARVLKELTSYLSDYFEIGKIKTIDTFLEQFKMQCVDK